MILTLFDYLGTLVFANSGVLAGARHRMDPVGIFVLAVSTAGVAGGVVFYLFFILGAANPLMFVAVTLTIFIVRLLAIFRNWSLPTPKL